MDDSFPQHKQAIDVSTNMLVKYGQDNNIIIMGQVTICTKDGKHAFVKQFSSHPNINIKT